MVCLKVTVLLLVFVSLGLGTDDDLAIKRTITELEYLNKNVNPCDDFYEFSCGNFKNVKPRPDSMPLWDHFIILQEEIHSVVKTILQSKGEESDPIALTKARTVYRACIDTDYLDMLNIPELQILGDIGNWPLISRSSKDDQNFDWNSVGRLISEYGVPLFFNIEVIPDLFAATENIIYISRDKILNPAVHSYVEESSSTNFLKARMMKTTGKDWFQSFLAKIALHLRDKSGSFRSTSLILNDIPHILDFMCNMQLGGIKDSKYNGTYTLKTVEQLQTWTDTEIGNIHLNWLEFLNNVFHKSGMRVEKNSTVMITDMSTFYGVLNLVKLTSPEMLKNFVITRLFTYTAPDSSRVMRKAYEQFRRDMNDSVYNRSDYCVRKVLSYPSGMGLTLALTYEYQRYHVDNNKIRRAAEMINDLTAAFIDILNESDWLDEQTRSNAFKKVDKMITLLAYPNFVTNPRLLDKYYENVRVCAWDHFGNSQRLRAFGMASNLALLGTRNREVWQLSPLEVNAYYNAQNNRILFPVSMLNSIFYTGEVSAIDYGRIGAIIGHEITHGFDSSGMFYDEDGSLTTGWWTSKTMLEYNKRKDCFLQQYSKYYISEIGKYVDSSKSLRENLADNGGLREAFKAFQKLKNRAKEVTKSIEGYTPEQQFFIGYGTLWCTQHTSEYLARTHGGSYPPAKYRVIGAVSNNRQFSEAFGCPTASNMNPKDKCILW